MAIINQALEEQIGSLSDKDACDIAKTLAARMSETAVPQRSLDEMGKTLEEPLVIAGLLENTAITDEPGWNRTHLAPESAGEVSRELLRACARDEELSKGLQHVLDNYEPDPTMNAGALTVAVAVGLSYLLVVGDVDLDLGFLKIKKREIPLAKQAQLAKEMLPKIIEAVVRALRG